MKDEAYWHKKHPLVRQTYNGRPLPTGKMYALDVRRFIWADDVVLAKYAPAQINPKEPGLCDRVAMEIQRWVVAHIKYVSDETLGVPEYWLFPIETLKMGRGDCEDGACLTASLLLNAGVPAWRVRVAAGLVYTNPGSGGHGWGEYCRETDNEWVGLDWCLHEDSRLPICDRPLIKDRPEYFRGEKRWFSFNHLNAWGHRQFEMRGRIRGQVGADKRNDKYGR